MLLDLNKQAYGIIFDVSQNSRWRPSVKGLKSSKFDPAFRSSSSDLTKIGMDMVFDPKNKPTEEFFIFLKIQDGGLRPKVQNRSNLTLQITFWLGIWIRFIGSRQNLAWTYYLTLGTTPRKNFSFFSKSKMAAAAITANYEIAHNLKSIQLRDPIFFPRPMFSRVRNAMKLSFAFYDLSNYLKIKKGRHFCDFTLIREAYTFFPRPMFSRVRNAMKLSFEFYDHSNYLKIKKGRHLGRNRRFET